MASTPAWPIQRPSPDGGAGTMRTLSCSRSMPACVNMCFRPKTGAASDDETRIPIMHPETAAHQAMWQSIEEAAPRLAIETTAGGVHNTAEIERVIASFAQKPDGGPSVVRMSCVLKKLSVRIVLSERSI